MNFKGHEELKDMNKSELINLWKDTVNPHRKRGKISIIEKTETVQRKNWRGEWYNYELTSRISRESAGTNMSEYRPVVGDDEYTWGEMKKYPAAMVRLFLYQHLAKVEGIGEEE